MTHDIPQLTQLLRSFFNTTELRRFMSALDEGNEMLASMPSGTCSVAEVCAEAAALIDRWGMSDAELLTKLFQHRPTRLPELFAYHRLRSVAPMTTGERSKSIEIAASIGARPVGVYRLHPGQVKSIGRSAEADIQFPVDLVKLSRLHAWLSWPPGGPELQDLNSKNGTWINGRRCGRAQLHDGDAVHLGEVILRIQEPDRTETACAHDHDTLS